MLMHLRNYSYSSAKREHRTICDSLNVPHLTLHHLAAYEGIPPEILAKELGVK
jgi:hypothetical protein